MIPMVGVTSQVVREAKWYKFVGELGFEAIEINRQHSKLYFNMYFLEKIKRYTQGFDLSLHSGTAGVFQPYENFTRANLATLTAEIDICHFLGAGQLVFHMTDGFLSAENKKRFRDVLSHAEEMGVEMLYESNSTLVGDYAYDILDSFPKLGYVLDLGHLNNGHGNGWLGCSIDEFISRVASRVVYVHASNNSGRRDEHLDLDSGTLDWRGVLDKLNLSKIRKIIVEVRNLDLVEDSRLSLLTYLAEDMTAPKIYPVGPRLSSRIGAHLYPKQ